jgi:hypothetical protein
VRTALVGAWCRPLCDEWVRAPAKVPVSVIEVLKSRERNGYVVLPQPPRLMPGAHQLVELPKRDIRAVT